ncbi:Ubiquitin carboxyl-terminal hydrolase 12 [Quillaja saponaria]|uniref:Ubiquitin carboxyl-terminal hydrolase 12 n=1 Tax=Quillaja saponaria TaxID=32244 RepID=A0AAD7L3I2_QUISA|nr:Ubiquitin carboxyl-terminal hydrolase 12 [Quillaja saponaria]
MKTEWGIAEFLSLNTYKDASNGYLVDDCCVFGAEVSVVECTGKGECLSIIEGQVNCTYTWMIQDFETVEKDTYVDSEKFTVGGRQCFVDSDGEEVKRFHATKTEWGFEQFLPHSTFKNASNGYLLDDSCVFGAEAFVVNCTGHCECVSMVKEPATAKYSCTIKNFTTLGKDGLCSELFNIGEDGSLAFIQKGRHKCKVVPCLCINFQKILPHLNFHQTERFTCNSSYV